MRTPASRRGAATLRIASGFAGMHKLGRVGLFCSLLFVATALAQVPQLINYQGRVVVGSTNFNGTGHFKFALVNANGTTTYWSNNGSSVNGSQPTAAVPLTVANGLYSVLLGDATLTNMTTIPSTVFNNNDVRLRVWFDDGANGFQQLSPDQRIAAVGYALMANNVVDGAITSAKIAPGAVGATQLGSGAVQAGNLAAGVGGTWQSVAGTSVNAQGNTSYAVTSDSLTSVMLPSNANVGDVVRISGAGAGGWTIASAAGQVISGLNVALHTVWTPRESSRTWGGIASSDDGAKLVTVVDGGRIYTSANYGATWTARESSRFWQNVASSADGTKLLAAAFNGQLYTSADSGVTWTARETARPWVGVASSADGSKLAAVVYGGQIYTSTDSGATWTARESVRNWQNIASSADGTKLVALVDGGQIYTSTNSGVNWNARDSNRAWRGIAASADGLKLLATANNGMLYRSTDSGANWTPIENSRAWRQAASSADGTRLMAVVSNGQVYTSTDSGATWTARENTRNWYGAASSADGTRLAATARGAQIYTSSPIVNGAHGEVASLQYLGNGEWRTLAESQIAANAVTSTQIAQGAVGSTQLANGAVGTAQLADGAVGSAQIKGGAIGSEHIGIGAIDGSHIAGGSIGTTQLAKPPQSGAISSATLTNHFVRGQFTVPFSPSFAVAPNVTVSIESAAATELGGSANVVVTSKTAAAFTGQWNREVPKRVVIDDPFSSSFASMAIVNGRPAMCYYDGTGTARDLMYVRALDATGTAWGNPIAVDTTGQVGEHCTLLVVNGRPAISYYQYSDASGSAVSNLKYVRATDADGTAWGSPLTLDNGGRYHSMIIVNGNPAISYDSGGLWFIRANNADGTSWAAPVQIGSDLVGWGTSMAIVSSNPAIAYASDNANSRTLKYVRATNASGSSWGTPVTVDAATTVGRHPALVVVSGRPAIAFADAVAETIKYVRATSATGATWDAAAMTLFASAGGGRQDRVLSMGIVGGVPAIAFYDSTHALSYLRALDVQGATWDSRILLDSRYVLSLSLATVDGQPAIGFTWYDDNYSHGVAFVGAKADFTINWIALPP
jgi:hypothetical protein